jgi:hypothetical protein
VTYPLTNRLSDTDDGHKARQRHDFSHDFSHDFADNYAEDYGFGLRPKMV